MMAKIFSPFFHAFRINKWLYFFRLFFGKKVYLLGCFFHSEKVINVVYDRISLCCLCLLSNILLWFLWFEVTRISGWLDCLVFFWIRINHFKKCHGHLPHSVAHSVQKKKNKTIVGHTLKVKIYSSLPSPISMLWMHLE